MCVAWASGLTYPCLHVQRPEVDVSRPSQVQPTLFFRQGFSLNLELIDLAGLAGQQTQGTFCICLPPAHSGHIARFWFWSLNVSAMVLHGHQAYMSSASSTEPSHQAPDFFF